MKEHAKSIAQYLDTHTIMQGFDQIIARQDDKPWFEFNPNDAGLRGCEHLQTIQAETTHFRDAFGHQRTLIAGRENADSTTYHVWISNPDESRVNPDAIEVKKAENGKFYAENGDVKIFNTRFMYDHQARAIESYGEALAHNGKDETSREVTVFATGTGKSYIIAHTLKAVGAEGVVIAPKGLGEQIRKEIAEVIPPITNISMGSDYQGSPEDIAKSLKDFNKIIVIEAPDIDRFIGTAEHKGWLQQSDKKHVFIDEAHEFTIKTQADTPPIGMQYLKTLGEHNDVLAITATPTPELYEALNIKDAKPAISMTMYDAMHRLPDRPFRPLSLELTKIGDAPPVAQTTPEERELIQQKNEPNIRLEALAGYFGREEYIAPDYYREHGQEWKKRTDNNQRYQSAKESHGARQTFINAVPNQKMTADLREASVIEAMNSNRIRYAEHKNIAFAVRGDLVKNLAEDFQAIHDGTFKDIKPLTEEVWKRRAQSAIAAYIQTYRRDFHLPEELEDVLKQQNLRILGIHDKDLGDVDTLKQYREAIRSIDPEAFRTVLPHLFEQVIKDPSTINLQKEAVEAAKHTARSASLRALAEKELHISDKEARKLDIDGKLEGRLKLAGTALDTIDAKPSYYALAVIGNTPNEEHVYDMKTKKELGITGDDVAKLVRAGKVMHVVNNYRFTTGFSDPDVMMTQRIIENNGDHIIRATQILGRPIREKDGVAAIQEIVGPFINLEGKLGEDRHFSCYDVVAKDYLERANTFAKNWQQTGKDLWKAPDVVSHAEATPANATQQEIGKG